MSLISLNDDECSQNPTILDNQKYVLFEPPSMNFMKTNDDTEGFLNYVKSHGNEKLNEKIDDLTQENANLQTMLDRVQENNHVNAIQDLLLLEKDASNPEFNELLFAIHALQNINLEIQKTEEEINKYTSIREKLRNGIKDLMT